MISMRRIWLHAAWLAVLAAVWLAPAMALAQRKRAKVAEEKVEPSYALEYGLVIFTIMIGLAVVFRPSRRADPEEDLRLPGR